MTELSRRSLIATSLAASAVPAIPALARVGAAPMPYGAVPSARQWRWHGREQYAFVHFSINTFTDKEWGFGDEDSKLFNPSDFDADQIVAAAKAGGLEGLILTAKHHDGFCLWPTTRTEHCIRNSPYKDGKGDIVREMADACRRAKLPFGVYLSPWDRNHAEYGRPAYVDYFRAQLTELCTRYGELFEVWFDGANGGDGYYGGAREARKIDAPRYYDWPSIVALVHKLQPDACTFDPLGADIRWVGNEDGVAGDPCWPTMPNKPYDQKEGNSGVRGGALWWPAETDVSIRPGWFYHADEDSKVKGPERLVRLYDELVGRGTNLNLNIPPDRRGRIPDQDVKILKSFGDAIRATFARDLAQGAVAHASHSRGPGFEPARVLDGNRESYWASPDGVTDPTLTLDLKPGTRFDVIRLREYLPLGVRVTRFAVDAEFDGSWRTLAEHECISCAARHPARRADRTAPRAVARDRGAGLPGDQRIRAVPGSRTGAGAGDRVDRSQHSRRDQMDDRIGQRARRGEAARQRGGEHLGPAKPDAGNTGPCDRRSGRRYDSGGVQPHTLASGDDGCGAAQRLYRRNELGWHQLGTWREWRILEYRLCVVDPADRLRQGSIRTVPATDLFRTGGARRTACDSWHRRVHHPTLIFSASIVWEGVSRCRTRLRPRARDPSPRQAPNIALGMLVSPIG